MAAVLFAMAPEFSRMPVDSEQAEPASIDTNTTA
jgi:hypothetical protein